MGSRSGPVMRRPSALGRCSSRFVHPELTEFGGGGSGQSTDAITLDVHAVPHRSQAIRLAYVVDLLGVDVSLCVTNHARQSVEYQIAWEVRSQTSPTSSRSMPVR